MWGRWAKMVPCAKVTKGCSDEEVTPQQQHLRGWGWGVGELVILMGWCRRALVRIPKQGRSQARLLSGMGTEGREEGVA